MFTWALGVVVVGFAMGAGTRVWGLRHQQRGAETLVSRMGEVQTGSEIQTGKGRRWVRRGWGCDEIKYSQAVSRCMGTGAELSGGVHG